MLKQRIFTAVLLVPLVVWIILGLPTAYVATLFGAIVLLGAWEWVRLFAVSRLCQLAYLFLFVVMLVAARWLISVPAVVVAVLTGAVLWWLAAWYLVHAAQREHAGMQPDTTRRSDLMPRWSLFGPLLGIPVLIPAFLGVTALHADQSLGPPLVLYCLTLMWVADTAAYFTGRKLGKRKLAPWVSPGKTWEGALGALIACAIWSVLGGNVLGLSGMQLWWLVPLSLVAVCFSIVGDLFESMMKRYAHVKDSGQLLPGHGGVLDRIDSVTAGVPVFALGMLLLS